MSIKMENFIKENILDALSRKFEHNPETSLSYLEDCEESVSKVMSFIKETKGYYKAVQQIKIKESEKV